MIAPSYPEDTRLLWIPETTESIETHTQNCDQQRISDYVAVTLVCVNTLYDVHTMRLPHTTFLEMYSVFGCPVDRLDR